MYADMHVHTSHSDGTLTPAETVAQAKRAGLAAIGVADHDTLAGLPEAKEAARFMQIEVIPAVEINAEGETGEVHILAYYPGNALQEHLEHWRNQRLGRMEEMISRLERLGVKVSRERVYEVVGNAAPGRPHLARVLQEEGYVSGRGEAFEKYLGAGRPGYVSRMRPTPHQAVRIARESLGIPVLAHPGLSHADSLVKGLVEEGLMGIEAYYPDHGLADTERYLRLCKDMNLLVTGGSDSHGPGSGRVALGDFRVPYRLVAKLKEAKPRR